MILHQSENLVIPIAPPFWPVFFTGRLVTRFLGTTVAFGMNLPDSDDQVVLVFPLDSTNELPSVNRLLSTFHGKQESVRVFNPTKLHIPLGDLLQLAGVKAVAVEHDNRRVNVFYAVKELGAHQVLADVELTGKQVHASSHDVSVWPASISEIDIRPAGHVIADNDVNFCMLSVESFEHAEEKLTNIIALNRIGTQTVLSETVSIGTRPEEVEFNQMEPPESGSGRYMN